jgi:hypothetical protein
LGMDDLEGYFRAHLNRGISLLQQRVRSVADIANLVPSDRITSGRSSKS